MIYFFLNLSAVCVSSLLFWRFMEHRTCWWLKFADPLTLLTFCREIRVTSNENAVLHLHFVTQSLFLYAAHLRIKNHELSFDSEAFGAETEEDGGVFLCKKSSWCRLRGVPVCSWGSSSHVYQQRCSSIVELFVMKRDVTAAQWQTGSLNINKLDILPIFSHNNRLSESTIPPILSEILKPSINFCSSAV